MNAGVSILPEPTVRREVEARRVVAIPMAGADFVRPVGLMATRWSNHKVPQALKLRHDIT